MPSQGLTWELMSTLSLAVAAMVASRKMSVMPANRGDNYDNYENKERTSRKAS